MDILLIRQILKRRLVQLLIRHCHALPRLFLALVLPDEGKAQKDKDEHFEAVAHEERADAESVRWGLIGFVEEWSGWKSAGDVR
jgi:hypothetical protein